MASLVNSIILLFYIYKFIKLDENIDAVADGNDEKFFNCSEKIEKSILIIVAYKNDTKLC